MEAWFGLSWKGTPHTSESGYVTCIPVPWHILQGCHPQWKPEFLLLTDEDLTTPCPIFLYTLLEPGGKEESFKPIHGLSALEPG